MESWHRHPVLFLFLLLPAFVWLIAFFVTPLSFVWVLGFGERDGPVDINITWTLQNYIDAFDPIYISLFIKSIWIAAIATFVTLVAGFPVALAISFADNRLKFLLLVLIVLPFWTNMLIRTYAMIAFLRSKGYLNYTIEYIWSGSKYLAAFVGLDGLFGERFVPLELLYNNNAVIMGIVYVYLPFMVLPLYASLEKIDRSCLEASSDLGATPFQTFWRVTVPLAMPGIYSGILLVFILSLGTFLISDLLGGKDSQLIGNVIERQFKAANNWPLGSAMSFILLYITFIALFLRALFSKENKDGRT